MTPWYQRLWLQLAATVLAPAAVLALTLVLVRTPLEDAVQATGRVAHTNAVIADATRLLRLAVDAETGQRGYLLTGEQTFLHDFREAYAAFGPVLEHLAELVEDNPEQRSRTDALGATFERWLDQAALPQMAARDAAPVGRSARLMRAVVRFREVAEALRMQTQEAGGPPLSAAALDSWTTELAAFEAEAGTIGALYPDPSRVAPLLAASSRYERAVLSAGGHDATSEAAAQQLVAEMDALLIAALDQRDEVARSVASGGGRELMQAFREEVRTFIDVEQRLLSERIALAQRIGANAARTATLGTALGSAVALALALLLILRITSALHEVRNAAFRIVHGDLSARAVVAGNGDLHELAANVNAVADRMGELVAQEQQSRHRLEQRVDRLVAERAAESDALNDMGVMMQSAERLEDAHSVVRRYGVRVLPDVRVTLAFASEDDDELLEPVVTWGGTAAGAQPSFRVTDCWAVRRGRPFRSSGEADDLHCAHSGTDGPHACLPLLAQGDTIGVLTLLGEVDEDTMRRARTLVDRIAAAYGNVKLRATLRRRAIRDELTGLYNRRFLDETLAREAIRARRLQQPLALVMADLDRFKPLNDSYGHAAGDVVLRSLGELLSKRFRGEDVACRYGGEEFVMILPGASAHAAAERFERVRTEFAGLPHEHDGQELPVITISAGVAAAPEDGSDGRVLLETADQALYRAKEAGRDRVVIASRGAQAR